MPIVTTSSRKRPGRRPALPIAIAAIVLVFAAAIYLGARAVRPRKPQSPVASPVAAAPSATPEVSDTTASPEPESVIRDLGPITNAASASAAPSTNNYVKKPGQMMLPSGKILTFPPPAEGKIRKVASGGRVYECDHEGNWKDVTPRALFGTAFEENFLALSIEGRQFIPAFLLGLDQNEVVEILKKDYVAKGDETEEEMAAVKAYLDMKAAALDYIDQGGTFDDFVMEIANHVKAERKIRADGLKSVMVLVKEGKTEEALERYKSLNVLLKEKGYAPIKFPGKVREKLGIEE